MKTGDKVRIVKICAPFIGDESLGKVSKISIMDNGSIFLDDLDRYISPHWIELVDDNVLDKIVERSVYKPIILSKISVNL
jgi:hypothetical protein